MSSRSVGTALLPTTLAVVLTLIPLAANAQNMSHEEEVVRNAYAKLSLMCGLAPLVETGSSQLSGVTKDLTPQAVDDRMAKETPVFTLADFKAGNISDIANDPWSDFNDMPHKGDYVLSGGLINHGYSDNGNGTTWQMARVSWQPNQTPDNPEAEKLIVAQPVSEIIKLGSQQWQDTLANAKPPITYTRYVTYTVTVSFQGRTVGPHKTIAFFGHDANGNEFVAENDLFGGENPLWVTLNHTVSLDGLLLGKMREAPVVSEWLRNNVMPASACSTDSHVMCCDHGKCGVSPVNYNRDLSVPLPAPKEQ